MEVLKDYLGSKWKAVVAAAGAVLFILSTPELVPLLPESAGPWVSLIVALVTPIAVYGVPNKPKPDSGDSPLNAPSGVE